MAFAGQILGDKGKRPRLSEKVHQPYKRKQKKKHREGEKGVGRDQENNTHSASSGGLLSARNTQFVKIVSRIISSKYMRCDQGIKQHKSTSK